MEQKDTQDIIARYSVRWMYARLATLRIEWSGSRLASLAARKSYVTSLMRGNVRAQLHIQTARTSLPNQSSFIYTYDCNASGDYRSQGG